MLYTDENKCLELANLTYLSRIFLSLDSNPLDDFAPIEHLPFTPDVTIEELLRPQVAKFA
ncbi:MAG: hypothetical protein FWC96_04735 [Oscillospiraceae bacterium]|nr:hypothetical protein [Oscillospiraceae bacterium]